MEWDFERGTVHLWHLKIFDKILKFENIWQYFEIWKLSGDAASKSLSQLWALRDTPAKAPENVSGDFPKSNSAKSSQKYQNIFFEQKRRHNLRPKKKTNIFWSFVNSKVKEKFYPYFLEERVELWIEIDMARRHWGAQEVECEKVKRTFKCGDYRHTRVKWPMMRREEK